ncbi:hypothetical protein ISF_00380 [Cordyceps fumosorosea ARSEF 2679]|uniref:Uncharacterized protein n=1 Tax=Cordyceps fumosorosea (strain ARSEF 2679) TaxID=1081104 RepID=A0A162N0B5_CORFA|nr:hypothetical protein ISF_00380 [Cordyceps fumosorosea ARSEF 2679]OAA73479.1 hypothetical protein ISF_00380 [Cordyceps fumosorosea ARSEF 2679]
MSDADKPFILPPREIDEYPSFSETTENLRLRISSLTTSDTKAALDICQTFCVTVQEGILIGHVSTEDMLVALSPFDSASLQVITDMGISGKVFSMIRSSIAEALEATQLSRPHAVPDEMWAAMFKFVAAINGRFHDVSCFNRLLTTMPESVRATISDDTLFTYTKTFVQSQATRDHRNPAWQWCCAKIGSALGQLNDSQRLALFTRMNKYVRNARCDTDTRMRVSFAWLLIQAYDARLSTESFIKIYKTNSERHMDHNGYRIWQLAVAHLHSRGMLPKDAHRRVAGWNFYDSLPQRWTLLAKSLSTTENADAKMASLCGFLAGIGETWHLIEGLIAAHAEAPCTEMLRAVANASDKLDITIALHIAANDTKHGNHLLCAEPGKTTEGHFETFMAYPKAESFAWRAIKAQGGTVESKMELIDLLSEMYASSATLSRSQRIRRARRAVAYQVALVGRISPTVLRSVIAAVTLDLDEGHWGRETHLRWATGLVRDHVSPEAAAEMQKQLQGWRHLIQDATPRIPTSGRVSATESGGGLDKVDAFCTSQLRDSLKSERRGPSALSNRFIRG